MVETLRENIRKRLENGDYHCAKEFTLSMFSGKWKVVILYHLGIDGATRYSDLERLFTDISHKTLSNQLKELMKDGLIARKVYPVSPPQVEYYLTEVGFTLLPIIEMMYEWGKNRINQLIAESEPIDK
ncbi:winged helix-turn-helix transcriptional regulator [Paenibacillus sp. Z6-24]